MSGPDQDGFIVESDDGTSLAVWAEGQGPALVLVHGVLSDHSTFGPLVSELRNAATAFSMDRRGRGGSGDGPEYAIEREFEDVAAVVDAVAARVGGPVAVWGHSFGADCAMGGAARTTNVSHLILYEPGLGTGTEEGAIASVEASLALDDREAAAEALLGGIVGMSADEIAFLRASPVWPDRLAAIPAVPRELRAESEWTYRPGQFNAIAARTLLVAGSESPADQQEATRLATEAIPGATVMRLPRHGHMAHQTEPGMVARLLRDFMKT